MALDTIGITLDEVKNKYPQKFQSLNYDVALDFDSMYKPRVLSSFELGMNTIMTLLFMKPGQYPSIPELGIDIESYLHEYMDDPKIPGEIRDKLYDQCNQLSVVGLTIDVYIDQTEQNQGALIIEVSGDEHITYGSESSKVIIGITYNQLNDLYVKRYYV
jgi:hypothetical protein